MAIGQTQEESDLQLVEQFFAERGLKTERIPEAITKTPDVKILQGGDVIAFCELKSPQDVFVGRVEDTIKEGGSGIIETGYGNDYRQARCIARAATKAAVQFTAVNPGHSVPNILLLVNHDTMSLYDDFSQAITGEIAGIGQVGTPVRDGIPEIDVYVWVDASGRTKQKAERLFNHASPLKETARDLLQLG
jgi:hypothetical protein